MHEGLSSPVLVYASEPNVNRVDQAILDEAHRMVAPSTFGFASMFSLDILDGDLASCAQRVSMLCLYFVRIVADQKLQVLYHRSNVVSDHCSW